MQIALNHQYRNANWKSELKICIYLMALRNNMTGKDRLRVNIEKVI